MTVFAFKSVDFVSQKGVATKKSLPPVKAFLFFCEIHSSHIACCVTPTGADKYLGRHGPGRSGPDDLGRHVVAGWLRVGVILLVVAGLVIFVDTVLIVAVR